MQKLLTKESLKQMLVEADPLMRQRIIGRALVVLFNNQTAAEQNANTTDMDNGVGFTHADARAGSLSAKYFIKHNALEQWQVDKWMKLAKNGFPRICKYHMQLNEAAKIKAAKMAAQSSNTAATAYKAAKSGLAHAGQLQAHLI